MIFMAYNCNYFVQNCPTIVFDIKVFQLLECSKHHFRLVVKLSRASVNVKLHKSIAIGVKLH